MSRLELPRLLEGGWTNAVFVTYGLNLVDFEHAFWPALGAQCRNKVILADGVQYLRAMEGYAETGLVHSVNQRYVAAGIFAPRAAHAKLILLTNETRGRLLVGSGNLSITGYASDGEQFVHYEYRDGYGHDLPVFKQADHFLRRLVEDGHVGGPVEYHLNHLRRETGWLHQPSDSEFQPLRHNLDRPFIHQLQEALSGEVVRRLTIMSPFFDERAYALERILEVVKPQAVRLLLQEERTSVDPDQLRRVSQGYGGDVEVYSVSTGIEPVPYFHNKLYLAETDTRAICLQGSPNLSVVAMLWSVAQGGNIELASLLSGSPQDFADVCEVLQLKLLSLEEDTLPFTFQGSPGQDESLEEEQEAPVKLLGGELREDEIVLQVSSALPTSETLALCVGEQMVDVELRLRDDGTLQAALTQVLVRELSKAVPLSLAWLTTDGWQTSNPIYLYNRPQLERELQASVGRVRPERFGGLDLGDEEVEHLLEALQSDMLLDRRSIWQTLNKPIPTGNDAGEDGPRLNYEDIDFEALKRHPRMQQYARGLGRSRYGRSRLQLMLSSITGRFNGLVDMLLRGDPLPDSTYQDDTLDARMSETEEEREELDAKHEQRRWSTNARIRQVFRGFINRFLLGLSSGDFQEIVGHEVMSHNFIIFNHLLWTLLHKAWYSDHEHELVGALCKTWTLWWGDLRTEGYFHTLNDEQRRDFEEMAAEYYLAGHMLATVYWAEQFTRDAQNLRVTLRDCWRHLLALGIPSCSKGAVEDAWVLVAGVQPVEPPRPTHIIQAQHTLCRFTTDSDLRSVIEELSGRQSARFSFEPVNVHREGFERKVTATCLFIHDLEHFPDAACARRIIETWMSFEELNYYRVASPADRSQRVAFYDVVTQRGLYYDWNTHDEVPLNALGSQKHPWSGLIDKFAEQASVVDREMSVDLVQLLSNKANIRNHA